MVITKTNTYSPLANKVCSKTLRRQKLFSAMTWFLAEQWCLISWWLYEYYENLGISVVWWKELKLSYKQSWHLFKARSSPMSIVSLLWETCSQHSEYSQWFVSIRAKFKRRTLLWQWISWKVRRLNQLSTSCIIWYGSGVRYGWLSRIARLKTSLLVWLVDILSELGLGRELKRVLMEQ